MTDATDVINEISGDIDNMTLDVEDLVHDFKLILRRYLQLNEILMGKLLKLDSIESLGNDNIRVLRKEQIDRIQELLSQLDQYNFNRG